MPDNYRALTRTYRPRTFDEIVSQNHVSETLKNAIDQQRLAHAYMFCGPRGVGKTTMARVLARTVNEVEQQVDGESLQQTLNIIEIDAASNNGVDDIRDLRERVRIPPQNGRYKIYIIDEVHMLSKAAFNALLKTLEEPPEHVIFIFATTEPNKVLPTILSRVQRFDFKRISVDEMVAHLEQVAEEEDINIDRESLHVIAKKADGALRDALGLLDQSIAFCGSTIEHDELLKALNVVSTDRMFQFMDAVEQHDAPAGLQLINELLEEGYDIQEFLVGLTEHLRNLYVAQSSENMHLVEASSNMKQRYLDAAEAFNEDDLMRMLHILSEAQFKIKEAHQPKIQFEITLLKLIHMERSQKLDALMAKLQDLKKNGGSENGIAKSPEKTNDTNAPPENAAPKDQVTDQPATDQKTVDAEEDHSADIDETQAKAEQNDHQESHQKVKKELKDESTPAHQQKMDHPDESSDSGSSIFGEPSLGGSNGNVTATVVKQETQTKTRQASPGSQAREINLQQVKQNWDDYVTSLKEPMPQMIYFQMQRVEPLKLKNRELVLRCNDDFAKQMVEEHKRELAKILEGKVGGFLRFRCLVQKDETDAPSSMSPYERFKKLQERDPKIKTLVELFGAELDYNLNQ